MGAILKVRDADGNVYPIPAIKGDKGEKGDPGDPGVSVTHSWDGTTLTVTSSSGTTSADLKGEKGDPGDPGGKGDPGVSVTHSWDGTTLTVTSSSGTTSADLKGDPGADGLSSLPLVATATIDNSGKTSIPDGLITEGSCGYLVTYTPDNLTYVSGFMYYNPAVRTTQVLLAHYQYADQQMKLTINPSEGTVHVVSSNTAGGIIRFYGPIPFDEDSELIGQELITFTVDGKEFISPKYDADGKAMNWVNWIFTTCNTDEYKTQTITIGDERPNVVVAFSKEVDAGYTSYTVVANSTGDTVVKGTDLISDGGEYTLATTPFCFYIDNALCIADIGSTWSEWLTSSYNLKWHRHFIATVNNVNVVVKNTPDSIVYEAVVDAGGVYVELDDTIRGNGYTYGTTEVTIDANRYIFRIDDFAFNTDPGATWYDFVTARGRNIAGMVVSAVSIVIDGALYPTVMVTGYGDDKIRVISVKDGDIVRLTEAIVEGGEYTVIEVAGYVAIDVIDFASPDFFTISVSGSAKTWDGTLEYSLDTATWVTWDGTTMINSGPDGNNIYHIYMRGTENTYITGSAVDESVIGGPSGYWKLNGSNITCQGNIETLLDYKTVAAGEHPTMSDYCYSHMFYKCTTLIEAPALPASSIKEGAYEYMFYGCTGLESPPELPAAALRAKCYQSMFYGCINLLTLPDLPGQITTLFDASKCYKNMFRNCSNIKLSTNQTLEYHTPYRIPKNNYLNITIGLAQEVQADYCTDMFKNTYGPFKGTPLFNSTYYTVGYMSE